MSRLPTDRVVVFLGPSLERSEAGRILDATYLPPIKRGDLQPWLSSPPQVIGIADGEFFQSLAVSPKEILEFLERGVRVYGASSMGALRAVELLPYGMIGVGKIFSLYRSGRLDGDDEVALIYCPETFRALSEPLVNIRFALQAAHRAGILRSREVAHILDQMKRLYFPERSFRRMLAIAGPLLSRARLQRLKEFLSHRAPDQKARDARLMLTEIRKHLDACAV